MLQQMHFRGYPVLLKIGHQKKSQDFTSIWEEVVVRNVEASWTKHIGNVTNVEEKYMVIVVLINIRIQHSSIVIPA